MNWTFLSFLGEGWFVIPWYAFGALATLYVIYDLRVHNTVLKPAMKWSWPIIIFFFSVIGLALYFLTARAPGVSEMQSEEQKQAAHDRYEQSMWRRVAGAVIHCVAGDGFGIMTGMVIARAAAMSFWQEFWFEYLVGFAIGWLIFQRKSMTMMSESVPKQLAMAFRAEFFSMLTVMGGMGAVMAFVTPLVATSQPKPLTYAFWGFGALGLLVGFVLTYPMNFMLVKIGWKHGMGGMQGAGKNEVKERKRKAVLVAAMGVLGCAALLLPAWLVNVRNAAWASSAGRTPALESNPGEATFRGIKGALALAAAGLRDGNRTRASLAMDAAMRAAEVGAHAAPGAFYSALEQIEYARLALQDGRERAAAKRLESAATLLQPPDQAARPAVDLRSYDGAQVIDAGGAVVGKIARADRDSLDIELGGWHDAWGFADFGGGQRVTVASSAVAFGPPRAIGYKLVLLPTERRVVAKH